MTEFDKEVVEIVLEQYLSGEKLEELKEYDLKHLIDLVNNVYTEPYKNARVLHELLHGTLLMDTILSKEDMVYINKNVLDITVMDTVTKIMNEAIVTHKEMLYLNLRTTDKTIKFIIDLIEEKGFIIKPIDSLLADKRPSKSLVKKVNKLMKEYTHIVYIIG